MKTPGDKALGFLLTVIAVMLLCGAAAAPAGAAYWAHRDVQLKNEQGKPITSTRNAADPYSPKQTCGACHGYAVITSGYHFQQGFDQIRDGFDRRQPWNLSPGMYGRWLPAAAAGLLAPKKNADRRRMDLSTYDWIGAGKYEPGQKVAVSACGGCHPGGGAMEYGRQADGGRDLSRTLAEAEPLSNNILDGDYSSRFTPDGRSRFRESGVIEADCLLCHLPGYRTEKRIEQINRRNYRWAATAGAGLGTVTGAVFTYRDPDAGPANPRFSSGTWNFSRRPVVTYRWSDPKRFTAAGLLRGGLISRTVRSRNCLQCHAESEAKNVGTLHTAEREGHAKAGLECMDCHDLIGATQVERLRHQITKGHFPQNTVRDDLDGVGMKTCRGCHLDGQYRPGRPGIPKTAKNPTERHEEKFPGATFHTHLIACTGCHATFQPARGMALLDMASGLEMGFTADTLDLALWAGDYGAPARVPWQPWMTRVQESPDRERYAPHVPKKYQWFGERLKNGEIRPIPLHEVRQVFRHVRGITTVSIRTAAGASVNYSSTLTMEDTAKMIRALTDQGFKDVVLVSDRVYAIRGGRIEASDSKTVEQFGSFLIQQGIVPIAGGRTYGARGNPEGCQDCHMRDAAFFTKRKVRDMRGFIMNQQQLKAPQAAPVMSDWGLTRVPSFQ